MALYIQLRSGKKQLLDITKIQKMTVAATQGLSELADDIKKTSDVSYDNKFIFLIENFLEYP